MSFNRIRKMPKYEFQLEIHKLYPQLSYLIFTALDMFSPEIKYHSTGSADSFDEHKLTEQSDRV